MTNPLVPFPSGTLYTGGPKTGSFTVPAGMSASYFSRVDTATVESVVTDIINSGTVLINDSAVSLQAYATATSVTTASLETLATSTLSYMTATSADISNLKVIVAYTTSSALAPSGSLLRISGAVEITGTSVGSWTNRRASTLTGSNTSFDVTAAISGASSRQFSAQRNSVSGTMHYHSVAHFPDLQYDESFRDLWVRSAATMSIGTGVNTDRASPATNGAFPASGHLVSEYAYLPFSSSFDYAEAYYDIQSWHSATAQYGFVTAYTYLDPDPQYATVGFNARLYDLAKASPLAAGGFTKVSAEVTPSSSYFKTIVSGSTFDIVASKTGTYISGSTPTSFKSLLRLDSITNAAPTDGDVWRSGSDLLMRITGTTYKMVFAAYP